MSKYRLTLEEHDELEHRMQDIDEEMIRRNGPGYGTAPLTDLFIETVKKHNEKGRVANENERQRHLFLTYAAISFLVRRKLPKAGFTTVSPNQKPSAFPVNEQYAVATGD
jgi:hypothetical protein